MKQILPIAMGALLGGVIVHFVFRSDPAEPLPPVVNVDEIRKIAKLATVEYHLTEVNFFKKQPVGLEWLPAEILVIMKGVVTGGVDLQHAEITVDEEARSVSVLLPPSAARITSVDIPPDGLTYKTIQDPNPFHRLNDADFQKAFHQTRTTLEAAAKEANIEEQARTEATKILTGFISALGYSPTIEYGEGTAYPGAG